MKFSVIVNYNTTSPSRGQRFSLAPKEKMNIHIDQLTKGLVSLTLMIMFTAALIAGQARANLTAEVSPTSDFTLATRMSVILDSESLQKIRLLPHAIDTILALPIDIELGIYERSLRTGNAENAGSDGSSVQ